MRQWIRECKLIVADQSGDGLDLSQLRIQFKIIKSDSQTPNSAEIRVYNLAENTSARIQKEFTEIQLSAGYRENAAIIFKGNIKQVKRGKENGTEVYLDIAGGDGDEGYNYAVVNTTLAAGSGQRQQVDAILQELGKYNITGGYIEGLSTEKLPRGKVMYGMARDYLRDIANTSRTSWSIQDGVLQFIPLTGLLPNQAVVLNSKTGLIGTPEQTEEGISFSCLLNPLLKIGSSVKIDELDIAEQKVANTDRKQAINNPAEISKDGIYRIIKLEYVGDTHGNDWFVNGVCLSVNSTVAKNVSVQKS